MKKIWSFRFDDSKVIFSQRKRKLEVPLAELPAWMVEGLRNEQHSCGGCLDLPTHGYYRSEKYSWCQFSREIANLYNQGWKWVSEDPAVYHLITVEERPFLSLNGPPTQTFYLRKFPRSHLGKQTKAFKKNVVQQAVKKWTGVPDECPYAVGYAPQDVKHLLIPEAVMVDDEYTVYTLCVKEFKDGKAV